MALYNLTNVSGANGNPLLYASAINDLSGGLLGLMFVVSTMVLLFLVFKNFPTPTAFAASAYITGILCVLLLIAGIISTKVMVGVAVIVAVATVILLMT